MIVRLKIQLKLPPTEPNDLQSNVIGTSKTNDLLAPRYPQILRGFRIGKHFIPQIRSG